LIETTLDLSRLETKKVPLERREVPLTELLSELEVETRPWRLKPADAERLILAEQATAG
jgi:hypothetical protein